MKKSLSLLLVIVLLSLTLLSSCGTKDNSKEDKKEPTVMEKIIAAMDSIESFEANSVTEISAYISAQKVEIEEIVKQVYAKSQDGALYYYATNNSKLTHQGNETKVSMLEAFNEGNYFFKYDLGEDWKYLHSPLTQEEFLGYFENENVNPSLLKGYNSIVVSETENKDHVVKLSQYDNKVIKRLNASYALPLENEGGKITDIAVTITAGTDFLVKDVNVEYIFSNTDFTGSKKITLSNYNNATKDVSNLKPGFYKTVGDATILSIADALLSDREESDKGSFTLSSVTKQMNQEKLISEVASTSEISYGEKDGKYYFDIETTSDGEKSVTSYRDGVINSDGKKTNTNDYYAKMAISELINPVGYNPLAINKVNKTTENDGTVLYTVELDRSQLPSSISSSYKTVKAIFAIKNYKLEKITYELTTSTYSYQSTIDIYSTITVDFND